MEVKRIKTRCAADILCRAAASVEPAARVKTQFFLTRLLPLLVACCLSHNVSYLQVGAQIAFGSDCRPQLFWKQLKQDPA